MDKPQIAKTILSRKGTSMFGLGLHTWEEIMIWSLGIAAVAALAVLVSTRVVIFLQRHEVATASTELEQYKADAGARIAEASAIAAKANVRAAGLERQAAELTKEAESAKAEAARLNKELLEMRRMRRLEKPQADALKLLFQSPPFLAEPRPNIRLQSVADSEAEMFALELQNFFVSCGVNVYPTDGGLPSRCVQLASNADGLVMTVKSREPANQAFAHFQRVMQAVGLPFSVEEKATYQENESSLSVLRKP